MTLRKLAEERAEAYQQLGHADIAEMFAEYACRRPLPDAARSAFEQNLLLHTA